MKTIVSYGIVFLLATGAAAVLVVAVLLVRPDLLSSTAATPPDTVRVEQKVEGPSPIREEAQKSTGNTKREGMDSAATAPPPAVPMKDSFSTKPVSEHKEFAVAANIPPAAMDSTRHTFSGADSVRGEQQKSMAKVLEAMDPESAARILNGFPDGDVKQIILSIKRRQAAKILAALDPDRAARIMR